jgi:hypothetical protein
MGNRLTAGALAILVVVNIALLFAVFRRDANAPSSRTSAVVTEGHRTRSPSTAPTKEPRGTPSRTPSVTPSRTPSTATVSVSPSPESTEATVPSPTAPTSGGTDLPGRGGRIRLASTSYSVQPFQTLRIRGSYPGVPPVTALRVQHREGSRWLMFPLPVTTGAAGRFTAYVDIGGPGKYLLRIVDPKGNVASPAVTVYVG